MILGVLLVLWGLRLLGLVAVPDVVLGVLALVAGILILLPIVRR